MAPKSRVGTRARLSSSTRCLKNHVFTITGCWFDMHNTGHPPYCMGWRRRKTVSGIVRLPVSRPKKQIPKSRSWKGQHKTRFNYTSNVRLLPAGPIWDRKPSQQCTARLDAPVRWGLAPHGDKARPPARGRAPARLPGLRPNWASNKTASAQGE